MDGDVSHWLVRSFWSPELSVCAVAVLKPHLMSEALICVLHCGTLQVRSVTTQSRGIPADGAKWTTCFPQASIPMHIFSKQRSHPWKKKVYFTSQTWKLRASLVYSLWYQLWGSFLRYVQASDSHYNYNIPVCFNKDGCVHLKLPWVSWKTSRSLINQSTPSSMQRTRKLKAFSSLWLS